MQKRLYRSRSDKVMSGVLGGLANYINIDPTILRVLFAIFCFVSFGTGIIAYIVCAMIIPQEPENMWNSNFNEPFNQNYNSQTGRYENGFNGQSGQYNGQFNGQNGQYTGQFNGQNGQCNGQFNGQNGQCNGQYGGQYDSQPNNNRNAQHGVPNPPPAGNTAPPKYNTASQHDPNNGKNQ